jgi:hypothetical protein
MKEKTYIPKYIDIAPQEMKPILWVNEELVEKGIYARYKIIEQVVNATGDYYIKNWFPPRLIEISTRETNQMCTGKTDFAFTFSIRAYSDWVDKTITTSQSTDLVSMNWLTGNATTRYFDWFNLNISSFSGSDKTLFITCYS